MGKSSVVTRLAAIFAWLLRWPRTISLLLVVACVTAAEAVLIERKYGFFTGGFLQAHPLTSTGDQLLFLLFSVWMDLAFFGVLALLWDAGSARLGWTPLVRAYHFFVLAAGTALVVAGVKYKVLAYFSNAVSFLLLKDIAGGNLATALHYASAERGLILLVSLVVLAIYGSGLAIVLRLRPRVTALDSVQPRRYLLPLVLGGLAATLLASYYLHQSDRLQYALDEKLSYHAINKLVQAATARDDYQWLSDDRTPVPSPFVDSTAGTAARLHRGAAKHIILIVLESVRGDVIGKEVNGQSVAPNLNRLARTGSYFPSAYAHQGFTVQAKRAMFLGSLGQRTPEQSLFSLVHDVGYQAATFSSMDEAFGDLARDTRMEALCSYFFDARQAKADRVYASEAPGSLTIDDRKMLRVLSGYLQDTDWRKPQFLYVNFQASHYPYYYAGMPQLLGGTPIPRWDITKENQAWLESTYWNAVAFTDQLVGELLDQLRQRGVEKDCVVAVIGDHGESLYDDGTLGHGHALNAVQTRVPLVLNAPGVRAEEPVGQVELMDLLLRAAGLLPNEPPTRDPRVPKAVFQTVGDVQHPTQLGMVERDERRTILDLRKRQVYASWLDRWLPYQQLVAAPEVAERTRQLVAEWKRCLSASQGWDNR